MGNWSDGHRKFSGKMFSLASSNNSMSAAQANARSYRKQGFNARIVTRTAGRHMFFDVYVRDTNRR
jgi:hypothetical protein